MRLPKFIISFIVLILIFSFQNTFLLNSYSLNHNNSNTNNLKLNDALLCTRDNNAFRDAIPSLDNPSFVPISQANEFMDDQEIIIGFDINGVVRGYPRKILRWHEVVNDLLGDFPVGVTYCPLTGSGIIYPSSQLENSEIGVTGYLMENNLVFYDRDTDSCFSQMLSFGMSGERSGQQLEYLPTVETTWKTWKLLYPNSEILSDDTNFNNDYDYNNYEFYSTSDSILMKSSFEEDKEPYSWYPLKMQTHVVQLNGDNLLFPFQELKDQPLLVFENSNSTYVLFYDSQNRIISVFNTILTGQINIEFNSISKVDRDENNFPIFQDTSGFSWNITGHAISGPYQGMQLSQISTYNAYWFAAITFFPNAHIYRTNELTQFQTHTIEKSIHKPVNFALPYFYVVGLLIFVLLIRNRKITK